MQRDECAGAGVSQYFIDENLLPIGRALALVRADVLHPDHPAIPQIPLGTKDPVWIPIVGHDDLDLVVITRDDHIRRKSAEAALCREHRVRLVVMTGKKSLTMWDNLGLLIRRVGQAREGSRSSRARLLGAIADFCWCRVT